MLLGFWKKAKRYDSTRRLYGSNIYTLLGVLVLGKRLKNIKFELDSQEFGSHKLRYQKSRGPRSQNKDLR